MSRELKFRVYSPLGKKFLNSYKNKGLSFLNGSDKDMDEFGSYPLDQCFDLGFIVQQYTGLKDKNDKEIYEGDILEWKGEFIAEVFFEQENAAFVIKSKKGGAFMSENYVLNFQIIGNIFEHKHLLEK